MRFEACWLNLQFQEERMKVIWRQEQCRSNDCLRHAVICALNSNSYHIHTHPDAYAYPYMKKYFSVTNTQSELLYEKHNFDDFLKILHFPTVFFHTKYGKQTKFILRVYYTKKKKWTPRASISFYIQWEKPSPHIWVSKHGSLSFLRM